MPAHTSAQCIVPGWHGQGEGLPACLRKLIPLVWKVDAWLRRPSVATKLPCGDGLPAASSPWVFMRLLAIETSESIGSVAALESANLLAERDLPRQQGSAQSLAPAIRALLGEVGWRPVQIRLIAVTVGPGSFTGLRVGVTTAKVLAYSVKAGVLGVDTLEAIAAGCPADADPLAIAMDAQRGQVVAGTFRKGPDGWFAAPKPWQLVDLEAWLAALPAGTCVAGPVLQRVTRALPHGLRVLDSQYWLPKASWVGRLAERRYAGGQADDLWTLVPRYYRRSAAEERWEQKHRNDQ